MGLSNTRKEALTMLYEERSGPKTITYVFTLHMDTLGAHPNTFYRSFTFDRSFISGTRLAPSLRGYAGSPLNSRSVG